MTIINIDQLSTESHGALAALLRAEIATAEAKVSDLRGMLQELEPGVSAGTKLPARGTRLPAERKPSSDPKVSSAGKFKLLSAEQTRSFAADVRDFLVRHSGQFSATDIAAGMKCATAHVSQTLAYLRKQQQVQVDGEKRGAKYYVEQGNVASTEPAVEDDDGDREEEDGL